MHAVSIELELEPVGLCQSGVWLDQEKRQGIVTAVRHRHLISLSIQLGGRGPAWILPRHERHLWRSSAGGPSWCNQARPSLNRRETATTGSIDLLLAE